MAGKPDCEMFARDQVVRGGKVTFTVDCPRKNDQRPSPACPDCTLCSGIEGKPGVTPRVSLRLAPGQDMEGAIGSYLTTARIKCVQTRGL